MNLEHMITGKKNKGTKAVAAGLAVAAGITSAGCVSQLGRNLAAQLGVNRSARQSQVEVKEYPVGEYLTNQGILMIKSMADYQKALNYQPDKLHIFYNYPTWGSEAVRESKLFVEITSKNPDILCFAIAKKIVELKPVYQLTQTSNGRGVIISRGGKIIATGTVPQLPAFLEQ